MAVQTGAVIAQSDLQAIHELQAELKQKEELLLNMIENVKSLLFAKIPIEPGRFDARLSFKRMHNVAWKQIVIDKLGMDYAESLRLATPTVTRCELVVIEHAIPPLWRKQGAEDASHN